MLQTELLESLWRNLLWVKNPVMRGTGGLGLVERGGRVAMELFLGVRPLISLNPGADEKSGNRGVLLRWSGTAAGQMIIVHLVECVSFPSPKKIGFTSEYTLNPNESDMTHWRKSGS